MEADGTLWRAVSALMRMGGHGRESARRFLGRCTQEEAQAIAECETLNDFDSVIEGILDRIEMMDSRRN